MRCWYLLLLIAGLYSCNKTSDEIAPPPVEPGAGQVYYNKGGTLTCTDVATMSIVWEKPKVFASTHTLPVYDNDILYTASAYGAAALDAKTGAVKWIVNYNAQNFTDLDINYGSSPLLEGRFLYTQGYSSSNGYAKLYCIDKINGEIVWQTIIAGPANFLLERLITPVIAENNIILVGLSEAGIYQLICFNRIDGRSIWKTELPATTIQSSHYPQTDGRFVLIHNVKKPQIIVYNAQNGTKFSTITLFDGNLSQNSRMYIRGNSIYAFSEYNDETRSGSLYKFAITTGMPPIRIPLTENVSSIVADENAVYISNPFSITKHNSETLTQEWRAESPFRTRYGDTTWSYAYVYFSHLIATETNLLTYTEMNFVLGPRPCDSEFILWDKQTGKVLKRYPSDNCSVRIPEKYVLVLNRKPYYPSTGGR